jgi:hypothetical protein
MTEDRGTFDEWADEEDEKASNEKLTLHEARELILKVYERKRAFIRVSPTWLATECMQTLDPERQSHPLEYSMAHLQFRQQARSVCAHEWGSKSHAEMIDHDELFPELQTRYPVARRRGEAEPEYILRDHMSPADIAFNIARLRREGRAKLNHADQLEAWARSRGIDLAAA